MVHPLVHRPVRQRPGSRRPGLGALRPPVARSRLPLLAHRLVPPHVLSPQGSARRRCRQRKRLRWQLKRVKQRKLLGCRVELVQPVRRKLPRAVRRQVRTPPPEAFPAHHSLRWPRKCRDRLATLRPPPACKRAALRWAALRRAAHRPAANKWVAPRLVAPRWLGSRAECHRCPCHRAVRLPLVRREENRNLLISK